MSRAVSPALVRKIAKQLGVRKGRVNDLLLERDRLQVVIRWGVDDVQDACDVSEERAAEILEALADQIEEASIAGGWEPINAYARNPDNQEGEEL